MTRLDPKVLDEILHYLCEELGGDWILTGGSLVRLSFDASRGTEDVDIVRIRHSELSDEAARNALFKWLIARGLGPEWVNPAVEPYIREVADWEDEVVLIRKGRAGAIYRPTLTLFVYLKLGRGSEQDLEDIRSAIPKCPEGFDRRKLMSWAGASMKARFAKVRDKLGL